MNVTICPMAYSWFKFYGLDFLSDPKMLSLSSSARSCWITLLCYASTSTVRGQVPFLSEEQLMYQSGIDPTSEEWNKTLNVLKKFIDLGMITVDNGLITVLNWEKRQETNLTPYERVKRYRSKKRDDNEMITTDKNRIDKSIEENTSPRKRVRVAKKPEYTPLGAEVLKAFEEIDPKNKTSYGNKTQRAACDFLISEHGLEKVLEVVKILPKTNSTPYFPSITSPYDLKEKWSKLADAIKRKGGEKITKGRGVEL